MGLLFIYLVAQVMASSVLHCNTHRRNRHTSYMLQKRIFRLYICSNKQDHHRKQAPHHNSEVGSYQH